MTTPTWAEGARTLSEVLSTLEDQGYSGQFAAISGGRVRCLTCRNESPAGALMLDGLGRLEGASDPADEAAVAAVTCPVCQTKGVLVLRYGPEADADDAGVLVCLDPS